MPTRLGPEHRGENRHPACSRDLRTRCSQSFVPLGSLNARGPVLNFSREARNVSRQGEPIGLGAREGGPHLPLQQGGGGGAGVRLASGRHLPLPRWPQKTAQEPSMIYSETAALASRCSRAFLPKGKPGGRRVPGFCSLNRPWPFSLFLLGLCLVAHVIYISFLLSLASGGCPPFQVLGRKKALGRILRLEG